MQLQRLLLKTQEIKDCILNENNIGNIFTNLKMLKTSKTGDALGSIFTVNK